MCGSAIPSAPQNSRAVRCSRCRSPRGGIAVYNLIMVKHVIHISEAEIVIEHDARPVAVLHPAEPAVRLLSESLRLAREHGSTATLDEDFARDVEAAVESHREPLNPPAWD